MSRHANDLLLSHFCLARLPPSSWYGASPSGSGHDNISSCVMLAGKRASPCTVHPQFTSSSLFLAAFRLLLDSLCLRIHPPLPHLTPPHPQQYTNTTLHSHLLLEATPSLFSSSSSSSCPQPYQPVHTLQPVPGLWNLTHSRQWPFTATLPTSFVGVRGGNTRRGRWALLTCLRSYLCSCYFPFSLRQVI